MNKSAKNVYLKVCFGAIAFVPYYTHSQSLNSQENNTIFGVIMGESTLEDITKLDDFREGYLHKKRESLYTVEINGNSVDSYKITDAYSARFSIQEQHFRANFLDSKIFELTLLESELGEEWLSDKEFLKKLRSSFNTKYKKNRNYSKKEVSEFSEATYAYESWLVSDSVIVEITDKKWKIKNVSTCLATSHSLSGPRLVRMQIYCQGMPQGSVSYRVSYKHLALNRKAFDTYSEANKREQQERMKREKEKLKQY